MSYHKGLEYPTTGLKVAMRQGPTWVVLTRSKHIDVEGMNFSWMYRRAVDEIKAYCLTNAGKGERRPQKAAICYWWWVGNDEMDIWWSYILSYEWFSFLHPRYYYSLPIPPPKKSERKERERGTVSNGVLNGPQVTVPTHSLFKLTEFPFFLPVKLC